MIGKLGGQNAHNTPPCSSQAAKPADRPSSRSAQLRGSLILHNRGVASHMYTCHSVRCYLEYSPSSPTLSHCSNVRLKRQAVFRAYRQGLGAVR
ncbi:hypothetical protein M0657_004438 [Pyricularia oryzae]|nr:hypothetical protein M9X92_005894 [Pyricularia oryzae]KAI7924815.1 hypothetical protein M0657_004438 [Pyricularia oryzae]